MGKTLVVKNRGPITMAEISRGKNSVMATVLCERTCGQRV